MTLYNILAKVENMIGDENEKSYQSIGEDIRVLVYPASNEITALYGEFPVGQTYQFTIFENGIASLPPEARITTTKDCKGEVAVGSKFIVKGIPKRVKILEQIVLTGVCVLVP